MTTPTEALHDALTELLKHAERANEIMLHEAGIGVCDVTAIAKARAALAQPQPSAPTDPCPQCECGGVCSRIDCGRKQSSELMGLYGAPEPAPQAAPTVLPRDAWDRASQWGRLYTAASRLTVKIGCDGSLPADDATVDSLMDALHGLDAGQWMPGLMPAFGAPTVPEWRPIETAPKDCSLFLCWVSARRWSSPDGNDSSYEHDVSQVDFCSWRDGPQGLPGHGYFDPCCGQIGDSQDVTHWMPIPAAPQEPQR